MMTTLGSVRAIYRYPVKSMLGEQLETAALDLDGIPGDRAWGVRDEVRGDFFVGKRSAALMSCAASYPDASAGNHVPQIRLPDGRCFAADAPDAAQLVGRVVEREVTLWPVVPAARQATPQDDRTLADEMRDLMGRAADEPLPDFSAPPQELLDVYARGGPFFDAYPLLLVTQRSLDSLAAAAPASRMDVRRFRPNLLIETSEPGPFPEQGWIGQRLRIGSAVLAIQATCIRCIMTTHAFDDVPKDPQIMRTLVKHAEGNLGVYATVVEPGTITSEDSLSVAM